MQDGSSRQSGNNRSRDIPQHFDVWFTEPSVDPLWLAEMARDVVDVRTHTSGGFKTSKNNDKAATQTTTDEERREDVGSRLGMMLMC